MHALYPHSRGRTSLAYSPCGKYLFTTGENMLVRRFLVGSSDEPETIDLESTGLGIATASNIFAVAGDDGTAQMFDTESLQKSAMLSRSTLPVRSITFSLDGNWAAVVGDDRSHVVSVADITDVRKVPGESLRHISFHPTNVAIVGVTSMDGVVRFLDLDADGMEISEVDAIVPTVREFGDDRTTAVSWSPSGTAFALPTKTFEVALFSTRDWLAVFRLSENGHSNAITTLSWSPNGRYIASGGRDGKVLVWDVSTRKVIKSYDVAEVLQVQWHPHSNEMSFTTAKGQLYTVVDVVGDGLLAPFGGEMYDTLESIAELPPVTTGSSDLDVEEENLFVSDTEPRDDRDDAGHGRRPDTHHHQHHQQHHHKHQEGSEYQGDSRRKRQRLSIDASKALASLQRPFQSGSTPWLGQKRYVCMTPVGYVWSVRQSNSHNTTTLTFFDQSVHREVHFQDNDRFDLASLTAHACLFASSNSGKIAVRFHSSLSDNWDLQLDLATDGGVQCVALSTEVAVVFTKNGFMRTYTLYGSPLAVSRVGGGSGNVICCAAHTNEVITVHQQSTGVYTYSLEDVGQGTIYQKHDALEITPGARLSALFFSEEGEPYAMDSVGILSTLVHSRQSGQARWIPVLGSPRSNKEVDHSYWPIGILESKLLCVVLKGQRQYPVLPMPITDEVDLSTPGVEGPEGQYLVARTQFQQLQDRIEHFSKLGAEVNEETRDALLDQAIELDKMLLRQFQGACQGQRLNRGLQLVQLIQTPESLRAAAKVAAAYELTSLADRILEALD